MKCTNCLSCLEAVIIDNQKHFFCWLCKKYYRFVDRELKDVTQELKEKGLI